MGMGGKFLKAEPLGRNLSKSMESPATINAPDYKQADTVGAVAY